LSHTDISKTLADYLGTIDSLSVTGTFPAAKTVSYSITDGILPEEG